MRLNIEEYREKVLGCWMGKNIGGTLGAPFEWKRQMNDVSFYAQELGGDPLPNDDLDIQLLWLVALEERGVDLNARTLAEYWTLYVTPHWSEYGAAKINMRTGLIPPLSGIRRNPFKDSCGSFIRSEIWACIAPGNPRLAARYAYEDAILDHGDGEGVFAETFCAAMESAAFVCDDIRKLIEIGLTYIPEDCGVARAVREAVAAHETGNSWSEARDLILQSHRGSAFFNLPETVSERDKVKGFVDGALGWDAPSNIGMLIVGLLYGEGDFGNSVCIAVNCGEDTDCTGATVGSLFGIMHGIDSIPEKWVSPIGRKIKTACLNLGELGYFGNQLPADVDEMTERTVRIARQLQSLGRLTLDLSDREVTDVSDVDSEKLKAGDFTKDLYRNLGGPIFRFDFFDVDVDYAGDAEIRDSTPKSMRLKIRNKGKIHANLNLRWILPEGWRITPSPAGSIFSWPGDVTELRFEIETERVRENVIRLIVEISIDSRPTVMLIPIAFLNGNLSIDS